MIFTEICRYYDVKLRNLFLHQMNIRIWNIIFDSQNSGDSFALLVVNVYTLYIVYNNNNNITHTHKTALLLLKSGRA